MFTITELQLEAVKDDFAIRGESISDWAHRHNFKVALVYSVLNGRMKCRRGEAHKIAVKLGLKPCSSMSTDASTLLVTQNLA